MAGKAIGLSDDNLSMRQIETANLYFRETFMKRIAIILTAVLACASGGVLAHSGGTDSQGCHMDHKTGIRHCH